MSEWITVYHGHQDDETREHDGKFFTTDRDFAVEYGKVVEYEIRLGNVLDTTDDEIAKKVIIPLEIEDPYGGSLVTWQYWNDFNSDTWEMVEHNFDRIIAQYYDIYGKRADTILVTEGGVVNYIVRDVANMRKKEMALTEAKGDESIMEALRAKYREYNQLYFNNQLPIIPMRWGALKHSTAHVGFKTIGKKGIGFRLLENSMIMVFSNKYKRDAESLFPILLHEMIHVYVVAIIGELDEHHGKHFNTMLDALRKKSGIDIPLTDTSTKGLELTDPLQTVAVVTQTMRDGRIAYAMFTPSIINKLLDAIKERYRDGKRDTVSVRLVDSELWTRKASNMPMQRTVKAKFWIADEASKQDLMQNSKVIWTNQLDEDVAYHGSARDFETFDGAHVGTGDGALTFGWGIYLAGNKKVASMFRKRGEGKMFEVDLPEQDKLLDWGKTYDQQSASVKASLTAMKFERIYDEMVRKEYIHEGDIHKYTGEDIYGVVSSAVPVKVNHTHTRDQALQKYNAYKRRASAWLLKYGIEGIRYRDVIIGDNYNYVIFDPSRIRIKKKK